MNSTDASRLPANLPGLRERERRRDESGQSDITREIAELRKAVEMQGDMLRKLLERDVPGASGNGETPR